VLAVDLVVGGLGAAAAVAAVGDALLWALVGLTAAVLGLAARLVAQFRVPDEALLGTALAPRALVAAATAIALQASNGTPDEVLPVAAALVVLSALIVAEPLLARVARFQVPVVAHLPGVPRARPARDLSADVVGASLLATMAGVVVVALHASSWIWLAAAVIAAAPPTAMAIAGRSRIRVTRRFARDVGRAVANYAPEFVVYTAWPEEGSYQVTMWLPYLKRAGQRFLIITRHGLPARALAQLTDVPVVEARRISDLEALLQPSVRKAFYVNASSGNGFLVRFQHLTHVFLGHGDSDKPTSYNPTHAMYDLIFAAGAAATRRYEAHGVHIPAEKFRIVGRPQVEDVARADRPISRVAHPVVLYAPTWRGHVQETLLHSLPVGDRIVASLLDRGATVIFRPHAFSHQFPEDVASISAIQRMLAADTKATGRVHLWGAAAETDRTILDCMNSSDAMVCDVSSVVSDYLFSGKPLAMVAVPVEPDQFVHDYPVARAAYVIRGDLRNLSRALDDLLGPDPLQAQREATRVDYLGDFPTENYAAAFVEAVRSVPPKPAGAESEDEEPADEDRPARVGGALQRYRPLVMGMGLELAGSVIAAITLASALLAWSDPLTAALAVAASWASLRSAAADLRSRERRSGLVGRFGVPRALLVATMLVLAGSTGGVSIFVAIAGILLGIILSAEPHIAQAWDALDVEVSGLPGVQAGVSEPVPRDLVPLGAWLVLAVGVVELSLGFPGWLTAGLSALLWLIFVDALVRALIRARRVHAADEHVPGALAAYGPQFVVYFAATLGASYQVAMWLPYFARIGRPFVVITRSAPVARDLARVMRGMAVEAPVVNRRSLRSLEEAVVPSLRAAFYVNNAVRNTHLVERRELTHVWLNHGDSEKPSSYNPVHAIYDLIFVGGQAGIDRYARHGADIPLEKFRIVGRPQVETIELARTPVAQQRPPTVLYAPTWQGPYADARVYSLPVGRQIVEHLLQRRVRVIFRPHPFNRRYRPCVTMIDEIVRRLADDRAATGTQHLWGAAAEQQLSVEECFNAADAMISDVSAVVSDFLFSEKPFAIVSVGRTPAELMNAVPAARAAYVLNQDLSNLADVCTDLLERDPLAGVRRETKIYYLGDFDEAHYAEAFLTSAREIIDLSGTTPSAPAAQPPAQRPSAADEVTGQRLT
jgi:CDP-glycerol glycerophosphotransferase (TagB/SpsB family)